MEIEKTPLYREIQDVINAGATPANIGWSATVHLNDKGDIYNPLQVVAVNVLRDYKANFSDEITCTLLIPLGKYARQIYPNRVNLQISLYKAPLKESGGALDYDKEIESQRYSATLIDEGRAVTEAQGQESNDEDALDLSDIVEVHFQLYDKSLEQIRTMTVGGVFRQTTVDQVVLGVLTNESKKAKVDNKQTIEGVDLVAISNKEKKEQIVVTQGVSLIDFPNFIQNKYGVYSAGLGSYIQNKLWYVFPLYDTTQFEKRPKTLTIMVLPKNKFPEIERSYRVIGDSLTVLMTGDTGFKDDSGTQYLNEGNGARFGDANKIMEDYSKTKGNKTIVSRGKNNSEFITDTKPDVLNNVPIAGTRITANPFAVYSNLTSRKGGMFKGVWENSEASLITPGMVVKIIYFDNNEVNEFTGVMQAAKHVSLRVGDIKSKKHVNNSVVYVFVNKVDKQA
jgi:hypothetical protein